MAKKKNCAYHVWSGPLSGDGLTVCKPTLAAARCTALKKAKKNWKLYVDVIRASTGDALMTCSAGACRNLVEAAPVCRKKRKTRR